MSIFQILCSYGHWEAPGAVQQRTELVECFAAHFGVPDFALPSIKRSLIDVSNPNYSYES